MTTKKYGVRYGQGVRDAFVDLVCSGMSPHDAAAMFGASDRISFKWWLKSGAMEIKQGRDGGQIVDLVAADFDAGRFLSLEERIEIQAGLRQGWGHSRIARVIGRDRTVIWREIRRNSSPDRVYYATRAHNWAHQQRRRPKGLKLAQNPVLAGFVEDAMDEGWSPKLISRVLTELFPDDGSMQLSHETIYRALYVQTRGILRADLARQLSTKRQSRNPHNRGSRFVSPYKDAFTISDRPAEVADRAVPGHWEGDLIVGPNSASAIGTLVERSTRYTILLHLPENHTADTVATAMIAAMKDLPTELRQSITWDRGSELADYRRITAELEAPVFFCNPHSPWQRGTNENTNRLLRHWFEKGSDLSGHTPADLKRVQNMLNARPRPTLDLQTPTYRLARLLETA
ncbi:IS30 family transposase [Agreia sp.]|uniref:IS30 family transposase n=1 Tax=Agreia sp. TaxID=1872416 RepID=UPI0035BBC91C